MGALRASRSIPSCAPALTVALLAGCVQPIARDPRVQDLEPVRICPNDQIVYRLDGRLVTLWYQAGRPTEVAQTFAAEATPESVC